MVGAEAGCTGRLSGIVLLLTAAPSFLHPPPCSPSDGTVRVRLPGPGADFTLGGHTWEQAQSCSLAGDTATEEALGVSPLKSLRPSSREDGAVSDRTSWP